MKVALLGAGKTGCEVAKLHPNTVIFNRENIPKIESLRECDIIVSFLPGDAFLKYIPLLIESALPVITGSTGFIWPESINDTLSTNKRQWIHAHNFSLGMSVVKTLIESLSRGSNLFDSPQFSIHDIHHKNKLDSPSGTALSWKNWLNKDTVITSERTGDVVGYHHLEMQTVSEKIKLTHEAKDRSLFAHGALWSAKKVLTQTDLPYGLIHFNELVTQNLKKDTNEN